MNILEILTDLDERDELHEARLLILLNAFAGKAGTGRIDGITKLAKLDFLLRYPVALEKALQSNGLGGDRAEVTETERQTVESKMIRFKYGPWDFRYYRLINLLVGKGLCTVTQEKNMVVLQITAEGVAESAQLLDDQNFAAIAQRSEILRRHFNKSGTWLKDFVYATFPEIVSLELGKEIE